jgi:uncharacterized membrane protein
MTLGLTRPAKAALAVIALIGYAVLAHIAFAPGQPTRFAAAMALSPLAGTLLLLAWDSRWRVPAALALAAGGGLLLVRWPARGLDVSAVYLLQYVAFQAALAALFGRTLQRGREPLVTRLARTVHGELPVPIARYTRAVTAAWALFFAVLAATAALLYLLAPRAVWSAFVNLLTLPCVALMFALEYAVRRVRFPWFEHVSILTGVLAFARAFERRES